MILRTCILTICCFLSLDSVFAQSQLTGKTLDASGNLIADAQLIINNDFYTSTVVSDESGNYVFSDVPQGSYHLTVKKDEHLEKLKIDVKEDVVLDVYIFSFNDEINLDEIVIQVESIKSEIEKQGFAVNVIETKEAALRNIQTNDLLDRSVGVRVRQNGGLGSSVNYNLNGMSGNSVKIFVDGIPISTYGASFSLNSIPPALIERIEVYKGVVPIHLSDDALGGAINVVLKKGLSNNASASVSYGSFNTFQSNFNSSFRRDNGFILKASGFYNYSDNDYDVWGKFVTNTQPNGRVERVRGKRFNDAYKSYGGQVEVGFADVKWADHFTVGLNFSDSYREVQHGTYMTTPYKGRFVEADAKVVNLQYRKNDFLLKGLRLNVNGMYSNRNEVVNDTVKWNYNWFGEKSLSLEGNPILTQQGAQQGAPTINHSERNIYTLRADLSYEINPNHRFILNHLYYSFDRKDTDEMKSVIERNFIEERMLTKNITGFSYEMKAFENKLKTNVFSKYYQQETEKLRPTIKTINGVKERFEEHFNKKYDYVGYGIAGSYLIKPSVIVLSSYEKAIRLPVENEIFGDVGENILENTSLGAEVSNNVNLGFKVGPYQYKKHKGSFGVNGFVRDTRDRIVRRSNTRINDAEQTSPFENLSSTKSKGFELELNYEFNNRLIVFANMSRFNTLYSKKYDENGNIFGYYNQQLPNEPYFTASGSVQYIIPNLFQKESVLNVYYGFNMIESFYTNWLEIENFQTPKQFIQDLGLSYVFPNKQFVVSFDAKNIFNKEAYDNFAVQKPGRAFYLKLNYSFNKF